MFSHLLLFINQNLSDFKHYLQLDLAPGSQFILQWVMVYNFIVWSFFLHGTRERFHTYLTGSPTRHLDFSQELKALFGTYNRHDQEYRELRHYYRIYLGFLIMIILATILFFLPQTWQLAFGIYVYHIFAAITNTPGVKAVYTPGVNVIN